MFIQHQLVLPRQIFQHISIKEDKPNEWSKLFRNGISSSVTTSAPSLVPLLQCVWCCRLDQGPVVNWASELQRIEKLQKTPLQKMCDNPFPKPFAQRPAPTEEKTTGHASSCASNTFSWRPERPISSLRNVWAFRGNSTKVLDHIPS